MNADARHGGLRPKRGLTAEFHSKNAHYPTSPSDRSIRVRVESASGIPKSRQTIVTAPKRANSRFFTDCYPISAALTPRLNQIPARSGPVPAASSDHEIDN